MKYLLRTFLTAACLTMGTAAFAAPRTQAFTDQEVNNMVRKIKEDQKISYLNYHMDKVYANYLSYYTANKDKFTTNQHINVLSNLMTNAAALPTEKGAFEEAYKLFKQAPEDVQNRIRQTIISYSTLGPYANKYQYAAMERFYEAEKAKIPANTKLGFYYLLAKRTGRELKKQAAETKIAYYINELLNLKPEDPKKAEQFENQKGNALAGLIGAIAEDNFERAEVLLNRYKAKIPQNKVNDIHVNFCNRAVTDQNRAVYDRYLAAIKALPEGNQKALDYKLDLIRRAVGKAPATLKHAELDKILARKDISDAQRAFTLGAKLYIPGHFNYGFNVPGTYENFKNITKEMLAIQDKDPKIQGWIFNSIYNQGLEAAYNFGDYPFFHELLGRKLKMEKANQQNQIANLNNQIKNQNNNIANQKKQIENNNKTIANDTAKIAEQEKILAEKADGKDAKAATELKRKQDAAAKTIANLKKNIENRKADNVRKQDTIAKCEAQIEKLKAEIALIPKTHAGWKMEVIDLLRQKKDKMASGILADVLESKMHVNEKNQAAVLKYFVDGGSFAGFDKAFAERKFNSAQKASAIRSAGIFYFRAQRFDVARKLNDDVFANMYRTIETDKHYAVKYLKNAPKTAEAWARSADYNQWDKFETRFEPYYGIDTSENMFLTDTEHKPLDPAQKAGLHIVYDELGVHVYLQINDPKVQEVVLGQRLGPNLEWMFRPGKDHAYHSFYAEGLPDVDDRHYVNWAAPTKNYRLTYDGIKMDSTLTPEGYVCHVSIPWLFVYDRMPAENNQWLLGLQIWGANSSSLSGLVHEMARALKLDFQFTPEQELAIKRNVALQAFNRYNNIRRNDGAFIKNWNDILLGDKEFYAAVLKDFIADLDEAGKKLTAPAADSEIEAVYSKYVPLWAEINYVIEDMRADYLRNKLFEE